MKSIHHCYGFCFHTTLILYYGPAVPRMVQITLVTSANISSRYLFSARKQVKQVTVFVVILVSLSASPTQKRVRKLLNAWLWR